MYLSGIEIRNFRGIRSVRLDFGETSVLVGENDSGKTTILDAICLILNPFPENRPIVFNYHDFFLTRGPNGYEPLGTLSIRLTFRERTTDEWSYIRNNDFGLSLNDDKNELQELTLEVMARPVKEGQAAEGSWRIQIEGRKPGDFCDDPAILSWIRRLNPVFRLKSGMLSSLPVKDENELSDDEQGFRFPDDSKVIREKIEKSYQNLISGTTSDGYAELHAGYRAALQYLGRASNMFFHDGPPLDEILYEILGRKKSGEEPTGRRISLKSGSAAEKIGMLLFTTAFLQAGGLMADPSAEPIMIIEDPEANLHPMTLESVKLLIERLKWQKIITTYSGSLLADFPLEDIRRIVRHEGFIRQYSVKPGSLSHEEMRRLSYHVRKRISNATFARCWLLVEGESENWLMPYIARLCGYDLTMEGIVCVEFAQCGIMPLVKAARQLGIEWFLMSDGDAAGKSYVDTVRHLASQLGENPDDRCLRLKERDIEHHLFFNGYADVYREYSGIPSFQSQNMQPRRIIGTAIHRRSKPFMAIAIVEAIAREGSPGVPIDLRRVIDSVVGWPKFHQ